MVTGMTTEQADLLSLSDYAWQRLSGRLEGLTDKEYLWEPVAGAWSLRPDADGVWRADRVLPPPDPEPVTTIAWRLAHLSDDVLAAERNATWIGLTPEPSSTPEGKASTAAEALTRLAEGYAYWRRCLERATDLDTPMGSIAGPFAKDSRRAFIFHELDEFIHHGAEVGVLRDLYRSQ